MAAATVMTGLTAMGIGMQAYGTYAQGQAASAQAKAQQTVAEYNARVAEQQALATEQAARFKSQQQAKEAARYQSSLQAGIGASGVVSTEGAPLLIQAEQAAESELENLMIGYEGQIGAGRARSQASLHRLQGDIYGQRASTASRGAMFGAGTSLLSGFGRMAHQNYDPVKTKFTW